MKLRLQIVGVGNMGLALLVGLIKNGWAEPSELAVVLRREETLTQLQEKFPGVEVGVTPLENVDVILAVKPFDIAPALEALRGKNITRILSVAAGVRSETIESKLDEETRVVRAMPNTPVTLGAGASGVAGGSKATEEDLEWAEGILSAVGKVERVTEDLLDAVTGLSGSGSAYIFYLAEALIQAGQEVGLTEELSKALVKQTLFGAARMLMESELTPEELRLNVTSPNGTTEKAIQALEAANTKEIFADAIKKATARAGEIADEIAKNINNADNADNTS